MADMTPREIAIALNMIENGSLRETGRIFRAILAGRTRVLIDGQGGGGGGGSDGREAEFRVSGGYVQWHYVGEASWTNLYSLASVTGTSGTNGTNGTNGRELDLRASGGYFQKQYVGDPTWTNVIALADIGGGGGGGGSLTTAQFVDLAELAATDLTLGPRFGAAVSAAIAKMDVPARQTLLLAAFEGIVGDNEAPFRTAAGFEGLVVAADIEATQSDNLMGTDTDKVVTAAAEGGFEVPRSFPYASTVTMDFTGTTPVWGRDNIVVDVTGAVVLQAATFPAFMEREPFSVTFRRLSGTGGLTIQNHASGAAVEYRGGLSSADIPALGLTAGDSITVFGRAMNTGLWQIETFKWKP